MASETAASLLPALAPLPQQEQPEGEQAVKRQNAKAARLPFGWTNAYAKTEAAKLTFSRGYLERVLVTPPELATAPLDERIEHQRKAHEDLRREHYRTLYDETRVPLVALAQDIEQANPQGEVFLTAQGEALVSETIARIEKIVVEYISVLKEESFTDKWVRDEIKAWRQNALYAGTEKERKAAHAKLNRIVPALMREWKDKGRPRVSEEEKRQNKNRGTSRSKALARRIARFEEDKNESGDAKGAYERVLRAFDKGCRIKDPHQKALIRNKLVQELQPLVEAEVQKKKGS